MYDPNKQNQIWIEDGISFIRELMASPIKKANIRKWFELIYNIVFQGYYLRK